MDHIQQTTCWSVQASFDCVALEKNSHYNTNIRLLLSVLYHYTDQLYIRLIG